jgi:hypothetical protein
MSPYYESALAALKTLTNAELGELRLELDAQLKQNIGTDGLTEDEWALLDASNKLQCVKDVRNRVGVGLAQAKEYVERAAASRKIR